MDSKSQTNSRPPSVGYSNNSFNIGHRASEINTPYPKAKPGPKRLDLPKSCTRKDHVGGGAGVHIIENRRPLPSGYPRFERVSVREGVITRVPCTKRGAAVAPVVQV
jgi:hypothetical protein